jgi:hypothetical protein
MVFVSIFYYCKKNEQSDYPNQIVDTINFNYISHICGIAAHPNGDYVYAIEEYDHLFVINTADNVVVDIIWIDLGAYGCARGCPIGC